MKTEMKQQGTKNEIRNTRYAFTLTEVLIVISLIALISGIGGGLYMGTYKRMLVVKAARDILLAAKYARIMAIERQIPYRLQLDTEGRGFFLVTDELNVVTERTEPVIVRDLYFKPVEFPGDVKIEGIQIAPSSLASASAADEETQIVFSPNGTAQSAIIQIGDGGNRYTVRISAATGKAAMYAGMEDAIEADTIDLDVER